MSAPTLEAFAGYGIEIEYMIVNRDDLSVRPIADRLLRDAAGRDASDIDRGMLGWSNELVNHVIEVKNLRPATTIDWLPNAFQSEVCAINNMLRTHNARLMPGAMHPWMQPRSDTKVWPHDADGIYRTYQRLFDTATHGWVNLQSMHVNLPFSDDAQFARLHAAIRLLLPIIPALAASSPVADGVGTGFADYRMNAYRNNANAFPSIAGDIIPETVSTRAEYEECILTPMYRAIAPMDRDRILHHEWLNSRGAIARFDRNAIEIRVIDTQECPTADLAVAAAVISAVHLLYQAQTAPLAEQQAIDTVRLVGILNACVRDAEQAVIDDRAYLDLLGYPGSQCRAGELWQHLIQTMPHSAAPRAQQWQTALNVILEYGPLSRRILSAIGGDYSKHRLQSVYRTLCECLDEGEIFIRIAR